MPSSPPTSTSGMPDPLLRSAAGGTTPSEHLSADAMRRGGRTAGSAPLPAPIDPAHPRLKGDGLGSQLEHRGEPADGLPTGPRYEIERMLGSGANGDVYAVV